LVGFSRKKDSSNYLIVVALILAGAFGNIIDFLRCNFDDSHSQLATLFSEQPYGAYFHGKVVDMFISIWKGLLTGCLLGGNDFTF
jgi:signal peptidase II